MPQTFEDFMAARMGEPESMAQYGVPGMKWGRRKGSGSRASKSRAPARSTTAHLTDSELKERIARLQMEKTYRELTTPKPSAGRKFVQGVLTDSGKKIATQYAAEYGTKAVALAIAKATAKAAVKR